MDKLALDGGPPVRTRPFPDWPVRGDEELDAVLRALNHPPWGGRTTRDGGEIATFEAEFAEAHGAPSALAVTNGTHALQLALDLLGVRPGQEVVVPALTPLPVSNAVRQCGALPVPVDVDPNTYCLDPTQLESVRTGRTAAVIAVHVAGHVADLDLVQRWSARTGVPVVQDAAHAHGARWRNHGLGEFGTVVTFSFMAHKVMTSGEGGAVLLPDAFNYDDAFARHCLGRSPGGQVAEAHSAASNYRMTEFAAALLRAQLTRLRAQNEHRERRWADLVDLLKDVPGVIPQGRDVRCTTHSHYLAAMTLDPVATRHVRRDLVVRALQAEGIPAARMFPPVYRIPAYWDGGDSEETAPTETLAKRCPNSELLSERGFFLRHEVLLGDAQDVRDVVTGLTKVMRLITSSCKEKG